MGSELDQRLNSKVVFKTELPFAVCSPSSCVSHTGYVFTVGERGNDRRKLHGVGGDMEGKCKNSIKANKPVCV